LVNEEEIVICPDEIIGLSDAADTRATLQEDHGTNIVWISVVDQSDHDLDGLARLV
jgi:hypothetical protein